jgi:hypothetical protein
MRNVKEVGTRGIYIKADLVVLYPSSTIMEVESRS